MKTILTFILLLYIGMAHAQYIYQKQVYVYPGGIPATEKPYDKILIKGAGKNLYLYVRGEKGLSFKVLKLDLEKGCVIDSFSLPPFLYSFMVRDIIPGNTAAETLLLRYGDIISFDSGKAYIQNEAGKTFNRYSPINDSLALLFELYDYHPADGSTGMHLNIYNTRSRKFTASRSVKFPGITMGCMSVAWAVANKDHVYAIAGLTGRIFRYDLDLRLISEDTIAGLFDKNTLDSNLKYEHRTDSFIYGEHEQVRLLWERLKKDTASKNFSVTSDIYDKDFISTNIDEIRGGHTFIEKVIKLNDDEVFLTISRPEYKYDYRDMFRYNLSTKQITERMPKIQTSLLDTLRTTEDYFGLDLVSEAVSYPYFYNNAVYVINLFDPEIYQHETKAAFDEKLFNYTKKHGYKWQISRYAQKK